MASKTRSLARGIAHERMKEEGIYRPNAKHRVKDKNKATSFFALYWKKYAHPPKLSRKKIKRGA